MSRARKVAAKILDGRSDRNLAFDDLCYFLERAGFVMRSGKGSHRIYWRDGVEEIVNLQPVGSQAKAYQVQQVQI